ncbi:MULTISPECIES: hypothetical protein [unclassified Mycobacterium]|uniref:hypothetical protein n=1 Tax=unclassified Mycobacterium TaxID=2642494 RepID=UPI000992C405|nr:MULTISPECIES: hypothetical protein [unclassified Mycobacterium]
MLATNLGISLAAACAVVAVLLPADGARVLNPDPLQTPCDTDEFGYCVPGGTSPRVPEGTNPDVPWGVSIQNFPYGQH